MRFHLPPRFINSRGVEVSVLHVLLCFGELSGMKRGMWECGVHPRQTQTGHEDVDQSGQNQVPVEGGAFQQPGSFTHTHIHIRSFTELEKPNAATTSDIYELRRKLCDNKEER